MNVQSACLPQGEGEMPCVIIWSRECICYFGARVCLWHSIDLSVCLSVCAISILSLAYFWHLAHKWTRLDQIYHNFWKALLHRYTVVSTLRLSFLDGGLHLTAVFDSVLFYPKILLQFPCNWIKCNYWGVMEIRWLDVPWGDGVHDNPVWSLVGKKSGDFRPRDVLYKGVGGAITVPLYFQRWMIACL